MSLDLDLFVGYMSDQDLKKRSEDPYNTFRSNSNQCEHFETQSDSKRLNATQNNSKRLKATQSDSKRLKAT